MRQQAGDILDHLSVIRTNIYDRFIWEGAQQDPPRFLFSRNATINSRVKSFYKEEPAGLNDNIYTVTAM